MLGTIVVLAVRTYAIDVAPVGDWRADALQIALGHDLADDRLALATGPNADLVVHAQIGERALHYDVRATWPGAPAPIAGDLALAERGVVAGELRDQLHRLARATRDDRSEIAAAPPGTGLVLLAIALVAGLLAIPFALARRRPPPRVVASVLGIGAAALAATRIDVPWLLAGGLAWGAFAAVTIPIVLPPVPGFGRIDQADLARVIGAWLAAAARRALVLVAYAPIAVVVYLVTPGDPTIALAVAVPLALLAARLWVRCAAAVAADVLDARLVDASAPSWHEATLAYVVGYLRRASLPVDGELLGRVRFLPGAGESIVVYGGGLAASRIVIPRKMLELALAPPGRPHDYAAPRVSTLHWFQWNAGLVMPTEPEAVIATKEQRQPRATRDEGEQERELFGEPPTLAGTIEPDDLDKRKNYRPHEDRIWLDWDPGEEYDGTDPGDRDFLFGAIVHALGDIQRHVDRLATFVLLAKKRPRASRLSDEHTALAGARHHLVQYLAWQQWHREDLLTARAFQPELEAATRKIVATDKAGARLVRLADRARVPRWRRYAVAGALAAAVALVAIAVAGAVRYHAVYLQETAHG
jgi:hypothetical protein